VLPPQHLLMADISDYQESYIARRYKRAGRRAIMIKAGDGLSAAGCAHHGARADASHDVGLVVVHYLMAVYHDPPDQCIRNLLERIRPHWHTGDKMLIDVEDYSGPAEHARPWVLGAQAELHRQKAPAAAAYSNEAYLAEGGPSLAATAPWWLVAAYDGRRFAGGGMPKIPGGHSQLLGKQYTDGQVGAEPHIQPGIGPCDNSILTSTGLAYLTGSKTVPQLRRHPLKRH